jgi:hypothetical protein
LYPFYLRIHHGSIRRSLVRLRLGLAACVRPNAHGIVSHSRGLAGRAFRPSTTEAFGKHRMARSIERSTPHHGSCRCRSGPPRCQARGPCRRSRSRCRTAGYRTPAARIGRTNPMDPDFSPQPPIRPRPCPRWPSVRRDVHEISELLNLREDGRRVRRIRLLRMNQVAHHGTVERLMFQVELDSLHGWNFCRLLDCSRPRRSLGRFGHSPAWRSTASGKGMTRLVSRRRVVLGGPACPKADR